MAADLTSPAQRRSIFRLISLCVVLILAGVAYFNLPASWYRRKLAKPTAILTPGKSEAPASNPVTPNAAPDLNALRRAAEQNPLDYIARSRYGMALDAAGKREEAQQEFLAAVRLAPDAPPVYYNLGVHYLNSHRPALADRAFCRQLESAPGDGHAHHYRGLALQALHKDAAAARQFQLAISLAPDFPDAYLSLALNLTRDKREERILPLIDRYIQLTGNRALAHYVLSGAYRTWQKYPEAIRYGEMSVHEEAHNFAYLHNLGQIYGLARRYDDAERTLREALPLTPKHSYPLTELGLNALKAGRYGSAVTYFRDTLDVDPTNGLIHLYLATSYQRLGDLAAARREEQLFHAWQRRSTVNKFK